MNYTDKELIRASQVAYFIINNEVLNQTRNAIENNNEQYLQRIAFKKAERLVNMKRVIAAIMILVMALSMSGCKISYWDGLSKSEAKELVLNMLEEKYGEEFVVKQMYLKAGSWDTASDLMADCSPKSDENIVFSTQTLAIGKERVLYDTYIQSIVGGEMRSIIESVLSKYYKNFAAEVYVYGLASAYDSHIFSSKEASIENFTNALPDDNLSIIWIVFDENEFCDDFDKLGKYIEEFARDFGLSNCYIDCYFVSSDIVNQCKDKINSRHFDYDYRISVDMDITLSSQRPSYMFSYDGSKRDLQLYKIVE